MTEAAADLVLRLISEKPAAFPKTVDGTSAKVEATTASFSDDFNVEVVEAIVPVEAQPLERYLCRIARRFG